LSKVSIQIVLPSDKETKRYMSMNFAGLRIWTNFVKKFSFVEKYEQHLDILIFYPVYQILIKKQLAWEKSKEA
jgi:hypothetical protein